jgi:hypothetical protein
MVPFGKDEFSPKFPLKWLNRPVYVIVESVSSMMWKASEKGKIPESSRTSTLLLNIRQMVRRQVIM